MNAEPHTHELHVHVYTSYYVILNYGDQQRTVWKGDHIYKHWWSRRTTFVPVDEVTVEERIAEAAKEMIAHHDAASIAAGEQERLREEERARYQAAAERQVSTWGSKSE